jgi:hypothetical protein
MLVVYLMWFFAVAVVAFTVFAILLFIAVKGAAVELVELTGQRNDKITFSHAEQAFLSVLENAVGSDYNVTGKRKIFELLVVKSITDVSNKLILRMFSSYCFDYVVLAKQGQQVACVVNLQKRFKGTGIKWRIHLYLNSLLEIYCRRAGLALLVTEQTSGYNLNELIERFEGLMAKKMMFRELSSQ